MCILNVFLKCLLKSDIGGTNVDAAVSGKMSSRKVQDVEMGLLESMKYFVERFLLHFVFVVHVTLIR